MTSKNVLYFGKEADLPEQIELRAGPLALLYEAGDLRNIRLGEHELLRRIYVAIRDRNWGTVPGVLTERLRRVDQDRFQIEFDCVHRQETIHFAWHGLICGEADGTVIWVCLSPGDSPGLSGGDEHGQAGNQRSR